jgi:hypothetical protein
MKNLEKRIKQIITNNNETNLKAYKIEFGFDLINKKDTKRMPKNHYKMSNLFKSSKDIVIKYPIILKQNKGHFNIEIIKTGKGYVKPKFFEIKNKNFCMTSETILLALSKINRPIFLLYNILYNSQIKNKIKVD